MKVIDFLLLFLYLWPRTFDRLDRILAQPENQPVTLSPAELHVLVSKHEYKLSLKF